MFDWWNNASYTRRNLILGIGFVSTLVLSYVLSISNTVHLYFDNSRLERLLVNTQATPERLVVLKRQSEELRQYFFEPHSKVQYRDQLISEVTQQAQQKRLTVKEIHEPETLEKQGMIIEVNQLEVSGSFKEILQLINTLEDNRGLGKLSSINFSLEKVRSKQSQELTCSMYFQILKTND